MFSSSKHDTSWEEGDSNSSPQTGSLAVESAIILPVILATIASLLVLGVRLSDYMYLSQAVRELGIVLSRTPYMAALTAAGGSASYTINIASDANLETNNAQTCLNTLSQGSSCGASASRYSACVTCSRTVVRWYATQLFRLKRMFVSSDITLNVSFLPAPGDTNAGSGLCAIAVTASAATTGWLTYLSSTMSVSQTVPYVSSPVPNAGQNCVPG